MLDALNPFKLWNRLRFRLDLSKQILCELRVAQDLLLQHQARQLQQAHPNPLNAFGRKCFSQTDEDGLTLEILRRLDCLQNGIYAEFGVGNGLENNTLILAALGWKGFWVGGEELVPKLTDQGHNKFSYQRGWVTLDNLLELARSGLAAIDANHVDVLSLDFDGNDFYFVEALLQANYRPKLFIVEYNAKFLPPIEFKIAYDAKHIWAYNDYFGASLASFDKLFRGHHYKLVCCNSHSGANAFFVDAQFAERFADVPTELGKLYAEPRYTLYHQYGHKQSPQTIERIFQSL